jgi:hypothetical protein
MKRRDLILSSVGVPYIGLLHGCGGGGYSETSNAQTTNGETSAAKSSETGSGEVAQGKQSAKTSAPFRYLGQSDFAKSMRDLLYASGGAASIEGFDPYWVDTTQNKAAVGVVRADGNNGYDSYDSSGKLIAYRLLKEGSPYVDLAQYTGLASPNTTTYRGSTAGVGRATGVQVDAAGRVGMFINGFDTPSDNDPSQFRRFGPDLHASRSYPSSAIYLGAGSTQCLHMACKVSLGATYFAPAAGVSPGAGGQIGWRASFRRSDGAPFRPEERDPKTNEVTKPAIWEIVVLVGFWDSRNIGNPGFDGNDSIGNVTAGEHWIAGTLVAGKTSRFVEKHGASMMTGLTGWRSAMFYWNITRANMVNILSAFGATTTTPEMVRLSGSTFNCEIYDNRNPPDQFKPGQFGFFFEGQTVDVW